jgi:hypothetical protein
MGPVHFGWKTQIRIAAMVAAAAVAIHATGRCARSRELGDFEFLACAVVLLVALAALTEPGAFAVEREGVEAFESAFEAVRASRAFKSLHAAAFRTLKTLETFTPFETFKTSRAFKKLEGFTDTIQSITNQVVTPTLDRLITGLDRGKFSGPFETTAPVDAAHFGGGGTDDKTKTNMILKYKRASQLLCHMVEVDPDRFGRVLSAMGVPPADYSDQPTAITRKLPAPDLRPNSKGGGTQKFFDDAMKAGSSTTPTVKPEV